jgi:phage baseplate assembly protein W
MDNQSLNSALTAARDAVVEAALREREARIRYSDVASGRAEGDLVEIENTIFRLEEETRAAVDALARSMEEKHGTD